MAAELFGLCQRDVWPFYIYGRTNSGPSSGARAQNQNQMNQILAQAETQRLDAKKERKCREQRLRLREQRPLKGRK